MQPNFFGHTLQFYYLGITFSRVLLLFLFFQLSLRHDRFVFRVNWKKRNNNNLSYTMQLRQHVRDSRSPTNSYTISLEWVKVIKPRTNPEMYELLAVAAKFFGRTLQFYYLGITFSRVWGRISSSTDVFLTPLSGILPIPKKKLWTIIRYIQFHEKINENTFQLSIGKNPFLVQIELLRNHP